ncbi:MAG TPA: GNAT family protein [Methylomirabilota bacterium]|jgi:RimJ/RimL family protein N-acetyltransferase|nr:GNAT family protein [Methylomirabilota bacterium]
MTAPVPTFLGTEHVILRPLSSGDAAVMAPWVNDDAVTYFMFTGQRPVTVDQLAESLRRQTEDPAHVVFFVCDRVSGAGVGTAGLYDINPTARKAEFRILLGAREFWNKGYGTEVTEALTFYGFDRLNLNKVWLGVTDDNKGGLRAYEKAGFRQEGRLRQELYRNSRYYDAIRMSVLREEYYPDMHAAHAKRFGRQA